MPSSSKHSKSSKKTKVGTSTCTCGRGCTEGGCLSGGPRTTPDPNERESKRGYADPRSSEYYYSSQSTHDKSISKSGRDAQDRASHNVQDRERYYAGGHTHDPGSHYSSSSSNYQSSSRGSTQDQIDYYPNESPQGQSGYYSSENSQDQSMYYPESSQDQSMYYTESPQDQSDYCVSEDTHDQDTHYKYGNYRR
jgi:hypothetical protein